MSDKIKPEILADNLPVMLADSVCHKCDRPITIAYIRDGKHWCGECYRKNCITPSGMAQEEKE